MTHPFHPRFGQTFKLESHRYFPTEGWAFASDEEGREFRIPDRWTSLIPPDPFVVIAAGRSLFHAKDLLELAQLIQLLQDKPRRSRRQNGD